MALEGNKDISDAILKPMKKSPVVTLAMATVVEASKDPDDTPVVPRKFIRKGKFNKYVGIIFPFGPSTSAVQNPNMMCTSWQRHEIDATRRRHAKPESPH